MMASTWAVVLERTIVRENSPLATERGLDGA